MPYNHPMQLKSIFSLCLILSSLTACGTVAKLNTVQNNFASGNYEKITATPDSNNLDILMGAHSSFQAENYDNSDQLFEIFNKRNIDPTSTSIFGEIGKLAAGQMTGDYKPYMMDYLFVSYYQLWDALLTGRNNDARVIINQSYNRQQKMSTEYRKTVSKRQKDSTTLPAELQSNLAHWNAYSDIMNPALTYLSGLYYLNMGEYENARQYFVRTSGMAPNNKYIQSDLKMAEDRKAPNDMVWIFIETGFAPRLHENRFDIPWSIDGEMQVISIATSNPESYSATPKPEHSQLVADVDAMFMTEFREYQINNTLRAIAKAVSNYTVQSTSKDKLGDWGTLLGAAYSIATTNAEIRSWVTLPQHIYVIRIARDKSGLIKLNSGATLELKEPGNYIVHIRGNDIKTVKIK